MQIAKLHNKKTVYTYRFWTHRAGVLGVQDKLKATICSFPRFLLKDILISLKASFLDVLLFFSLLFLQHLKEELHTLASSSSLTRLKWDLD